MTERRGEEFRVRARERLPAATLKELTQLSWAWSTWSLLQTWGLIALFVTAAVWTRHPLVIALGMLGIASQQHALAILTHQAAHYRMYRRRWVNDLVGKLCAWPVGASMLTYRIIHRMHHNHLYSDVDPDLALMAGYPRGRSYLLKKLLKDLLGLTTIKNYRYFIGRPPQDEAASRKLHDDTSPELRRAAARDRRLTAMIQLAMLGAAIALGVWPWFLLLWITPLVTLLQAILRLRALFEHGAVDDTRDPRRAARTNLVSAPVKLLLFPFDMNYHIEHHLYPAVPHYRLAACHQAMVAHGLLDEAEIVRGIRPTLAKLFSEPRPA